MWKEFQSIDLTATGIDFSLFRQELVSYFVKNNWNNQLALKHYDGQQGNLLDSAHFSANSIYESNIENLRYYTNLISNGRIIDGITEKCFLKFNDDFIEHSPYVVESIHKIEQFTGITFGRIRLMAIPSGKSIARHVDFGSVRYHIPIVTFPGAIFVIDDEGVYTMSQYSKLYALPCNKMHIAVNSSTDKIRLHLMLVPITDINDIDLAKQFDISLAAAKLELTNADPVDKLLNSKYYDQLAAFIDGLS